MNPTQAQSTLKLTRRHRRLRRSDAMRALVRETRLSPDMFMLPLFVCLRAFGLRFIRQFGPDYDVWGGMPETSITPPPIPPPLPS